MDLLALTMAQVLIQILVAGIENRRIPDLDSELPVQFPIGFHAGPVLVKETMDVLIGSERIQCLAYIPNRIQYHIILFVKMRCLRITLLPQGQKRQVIHESLKQITGIRRIPFMTDMRDIFWRDTALEIPVAYLIASCNIGETDGEIPPAVVGEMHLNAFSFRQRNIYASSAQVIQ